MIRFHGKALLHDRIFLLLLAAMWLLLPAAARLRPNSERRAGLLCEDDGVLAARVAERLCAESDYLLLDSRDALYADLASGRLDCALILPAACTDLLREGMLDGAATLVLTPVTRYPALRRYQAAAALYAEAAPYLAAGALPENGVPEEEIALQYAALTQNGASFTFTITDAAGAIVENDFPETLSVWTAAALSFLCALYGIAVPVLSRQSALELRIGKRAANRFYRLPALALRLALSALSLTGGLLLAGYPDWILPALLHLTLLAGLSATLLRPALLPMLPTAALLTLAGSLALCPLYADLTMLWPTLKPLRAANPLYWLWLLHTILP